MSFLDTLGTIARGVNSANSEADRLREQELEETRKALAATQKTDEIQRGIAKERLGEYRTQSTHAIQRGDWAAADRINRQSLTPYNTLMGTNDIGDKLIGTTSPAAPDLRPESLPAPTIDRAPAPKFGIQGLPGAAERQGAYDVPLVPPPAADPTGLGAPRQAAYDPETPDYSNPENQRTIMRRSGYAPKPERIELGYGQEAYEREYPGGPWKKIAEADDRPVSSKPRYVLTVGPDGKPVYTEAAPGIEAYQKPTAPRYVRQDNGDGTFSMVPLDPGAAYNYKPGKPAAMKEVDEAKIWLRVDRRLAASKPIPSQDKTTDVRTSKPLAEAYADYEQARQEAFKKEMDLEMRMSPGRDPFAAPTTGRPNTPSRGNGGVASWAPIIKHASEQYGVPVAIIEEVMRQESGGNPKARSPVGARGLMQFMPGTASGLGINPDDPKQAIFGGARHLRGLFDKFRNWPDAIAAYNAGADDTPANPKTGKKIGPFARSTSDPRYRVWENPSNAGYQQTRDYVRNIKGRLKARGVEISAAEAAQLAALYEKHGVTPGAADA